jgi:hypothetical protein
LFFGSDREEIYAVSLSVQNKAMIGEDLAAGEYQNTLVQRLVIGVALNRKTT